jgi:hypothetical protein
MSNKKEVFVKLKKLFPDFKGSEGMKNAEYRMQKEGTRGVQLFSPFGKGELEGDFGVLNMLRRL